MVPTPADDGGYTFKAKRPHPRTVLRVFRADLARKFASLGNAAPYAVVEWAGPDGAKVEVGRTKPHKRSNNRPVWNWEGSCQPEGHGPGSGNVHLSVFNQSLGAWARGRPTFCGAATATLHDLLGGEHNVQSDESCTLQGSFSRAAPVFELELRKNDQKTGTIMVQVVQMQYRFAPSRIWLEDPTLRNSNGSTHSTSLGSGYISSKLGSERIGSEAAMTPQETATPSDSDENVSFESSSASTKKASSRASSRGSRQSVRQKGLVLSELTQFSAEQLQGPVSRLDTSGGTASFYKLVLKDTDGQRSAEHYVGKDLMRAIGEVDFYEQALAVLTAFKENPKNANAGLAEILSYALEYAGIVECEAEGERQRLLVMRNLRDGCKRLRMLDIKIGEKTADAGWQGKSTVGAFTQDILDGLTNSSSDGFRVEGFDEAPPAFNSLDPLMDVSGPFMDLSGLRSGPAEKETVLRKKAGRFMLQRMPASDIIMHLVDVHQEPSEPAEGPGYWTPTEQAEIALHEMCQRLVGLAVACRRSPVPQKWVGSSVALGFEVGHCADRLLGEAELRKAVRVNIFDWGRSELNTRERHTELDEAARQDRATFWQYYVHGIDLLAWEVMRCYRHRFGCANGWRAVRLSVYDYDSMSERDFIGQVTLPLLSASPGGEEVTVALTDNRGRPVRSIFGRQATITCHIAYRTYPETLSSRPRLHGAWQITLHRANNLPGCDHLQGKLTSDPFVELTAFSQDGRFRFRQQTCVIPRDRNPRWNEKFEVPVAADPTALHSAFIDTAPELAVAPFGNMLPPCDAEPAEVEKAEQAWITALDLAAIMSTPSGAPHIACEGVAEAPDVEEPARQVLHDPDVCGSQGVDSDDAEFMIFANGLSDADTAKEVKVPHRDEDPGPSGGGTQWFSL